MTRARLAPELSATLTTVSCWIMARVSSARALDDLDQAPALVLRERSGLHDAHAVPGLRRVLLVVRLHPRRAGDHLAVDGVGDAPLERDDHRLLHLVADDEPLAHLAGAAG